MSRKIIFEDKVLSQSSTLPENEVFTHENANEIKTAVNKLADTTYNVITTKYPTLQDLQTAHPASGEDEHTRAYMDDGSGRFWEVISTTGGESSWVFNTLATDKLDKGGYVGTAQDLKDQIDSINFDGVKVYDTLANAQSVTPTPVDYTGFSVDPLTDPTNAGQYYYLVSEPNGTKFYRAFLDENKVNAVNDSFEQSIVEVIAENFDRSDLTNKGAGGIFSGWCLPIGVYRNLKSIQFEIRKTSNTAPIDVRVFITENDKNGAILADKIVSGVDIFGDGIIEVEFDSVIENAEGKVLCLAYSLPTKALVLRTSATDLIPSPLLASNTNVDINANTPADFVTVSAGASATYFGIPYIIAVTQQDRANPDDVMIQYIGNQLALTPIVKINLPSFIYATGGKECNIFFDSIIDTSSDLEDYSINIDCSVGFQMGYRWYWTPNISNSNVGTYPMTIQVKDKEGNLLVSKIVSVVCASNLGTSQKCISIGDSTTADAQYLNIITTEQSGEVDFLGTRGTSPNNHEGRGGWKFNDYAGTGRELIRFNLTGVNVAPSIGAVYQTANNSTWRVEEINLTGGDGYINTSRVSGNDPSTSGTLTLQSGTGDTTLNYSSFEIVSGNPFYNDSTSQLDVSNYMSVNGYSLGSTDVIHINLGINDVFANAGDSLISQIITDARAFVNAIRAYSSTVSIGINLTIPSCINQSAFALNYGNGQNVYDYTRNNFKLVQALITEFDNDTDRANKIYLIASNGSLDRDLGYPFNNVNRSIRAIPLGTDVYYRRHSNALHPSDVGYNQLGDSLYAFLKFIKN